MTPNAAWEGWDPEAWAPGTWGPVGMLIWLKLDETTGNLAADYSGYGNDGILVSTPSDDSQWITGKIDGAVIRDDAGSITITNSPEIQGSTFTLSFWVKVAALPGSTMTLALKGDGTERQLGIYLNTDGTIQYTTRASGSGPIGSVNGVNVLPLNTWTLISMTTNGSELKGYFNGVQDGTTTDNTGKSCASAANLEFSSGSVIPVSYDDIRYYDYVLTTDELRTLIPSAVYMRGNLSFSLSLSM